MRRKRHRAHHHRYGKGKNSIEDHFDYNPTLERYREEKGRPDQAEMVRHISDMVQVSYTRQKEPLGLGHAVSWLPKIWSEMSRSPCCSAIFDSRRKSRDQATGKSLRGYRNWRHRGGRGSSGKKHICTVSWVASSSTGAVWRTAATHSRARREAEARRGSFKSLHHRTVTFFPRQFLIAWKRTKPGAGGEIQLTDAMKILAKEQGRGAYIYEGIL